jgi:hypothetical protein
LLVRSLLAVRVASQRGKERYASYRIRSTCQWWWLGLCPTLARATGGGGQPSSAPPGPWLGAAPPPGPGLGAASAAGPGSQKPSPDAGGRRPGRPEIVDIGGGSARLSFCAWGRASGIAASQDGTVGEGCVGWGQTRTRGGAERGRAVGGVVHGL